MSARPLKRHLIALGILKSMHIDLSLAGLVAVIAVTIFTLQKSAAISPSASVEEIFSAAVEDTSNKKDDHVVVEPSLTAPMSTALEHVARKYRVSAHALAPIFEAVQAAGREQNLDPLLLIAVISIESRFNPYSQSVVGAQGLMQIIPRYNLDKVPEGSGALPFLNPVINVRVGAKILHENIQQHGSLVAGLQKYAGAVDDETHNYANKVLAEKQRLYQISRRDNGQGA